MPKKLKKREIRSQGQEQRLFALESNKKKERKEGGTKGIRQKVGRGLQTKQVEVNDTF